VSHRSIVTCDECERDLTLDKAPTGTDFMTAAEHRTALTPHSALEVTVGKYGVKPLDKLFFCGMECLSKWAGRR